MSIFFWRKEDEIEESCKCSDNTTVAVDLEVINGHKVTHVIIVCNDCGDWDVDTLVGHWTLEQLRFNEEPPKSTREESTGIRLGEALKVLLTRAAVNGWAIDQINSEVRVILHKYGVADKLPTKETKELNASH